MRFLKEIRANTTTLLQTITKAAATPILEDVDLVEDELNNNHLQAATICLYDESIFLPSVEKNLNTFLQPQKLQ